MITVSRESCSKSVYFTLMRSKGKQKEKKPINLALLIASIVTESARKNDILEDKLKKEEKISDSNSFDKVGSKLHQKLIKEGIDILNVLQTFISVYAPTSKNNLSKLDAKK